MGALAGKMQLFFSKVHHKNKTENRKQSRGMYDMRMDILNWENDKTFTNFIFMAIDPVTNSFIRSST